MARSNLSRSDALRVYDSAAWTCVSPTTLTSRKMGELAPYGARINSDGSAGEPGGASSRSVIYNEVEARARTHAINVRSHSCKAASMHSGIRPQYIDSSNGRQTFVDSKVLRYLLGVIYAP